MGNTFSRIAISTMLLITMGVAPTQEGGDAGGPEQQRGCACGRGHHGSCRDESRQHASSPREECDGSNNFESFKDALKSIQEGRLAPFFKDKGITNVNKLRGMSPAGLMCLGIPELNTFHRAKDLITKLERSTSQPPQVDPDFHAALTKIGVRDFAQELTQIGVTNVYTFNQLEIGDKTVEELVKIGLRPDRAEMLWFELHTDSPLQLPRHFADRSAGAPAPDTVKGVLERLGLLQCAGALERAGYKYRDLVRPELKPEHLTEDTGINIQHARYILAYARLVLQQKLDSLDLKDALAAKGYQLKDLQGVEPEKLINGIGLTTEQARRLVTFFRPEHPFGTVKHQKLSSRSSSVHEADQEYGYVEYTIQGGKDNVWRQTDIKGVDPRMLDAIIPATRKQQSSFSWQQSQTTEIPAVEIMREIMTMVKRPKWYSVNGKVPFVQKDNWDSTLFEYGKGNWMMIRCDFPLKDDEDDQF